MGDEMGGRVRSSRNIGKFVLVVALSLFTGACVAPPKEPVSLNYSSNEFDKYRSAGTSVVYGQAFLRQQGGGVVVCAGEPVVLFPRTPSFMAVVGLAKNGVAPVLSEPADPRFKEVARLATCDAQGNFRFTSLPNAPWYVFSRVRWIAGDWPQGGELLGEVDTSAGGEHQVLLTDANRI